MKIRGKAFGLCRKKLKKPRDDVNSAKWFAVENGNFATGNYSFAAGYNAQATNNGAFVWSDSTDWHGHRFHQRQFRHHARFGRLRLYSGAMAQDFKAAFYPGRDDKSISTLEFDGVELAAIQGLN